MRLIISAGGTGGGIYPALSVAQTLIADSAALHEVLWIGGIGGIEDQLVQRAGLPFRGIHGGGVHGVGWRLPLNAVNLLRGLGEALSVVRDYRPAALLVTGGYITVPVSLAAWLRRVPILVYLPDIEPALAVRAVARLARRIAVTAAESVPFFRGRERDVVVTGYPTRPGLAGVTRAAARAHFGIEPGTPTVLVTGGSRGARSLNTATLAALSEWLAEWAVIHLTGELDWPAVAQARARLPEALRARYHAFPYLHEMGLALRAADLVVSRAGASALGEYPLFGLPAVLVPYPHAWRYQKVNADYLVARGAALRLNDEDLPARLAAVVRELMHQPARLAAMRAAAAAAATPDAARQIAQALVQLAGGAASGVLP
jgi:UDP-N-acetylglucosamine--N-acetylmuramyl-(pentapeptide) pyrophosphoryl-undecaprenol N-acetylglucosamine transferase